MEVVGTDRLFVIAGGFPSISVEERVQFVLRAIRRRICFSTVYGCAGIWARVSGPRHNYQALSLRHRRLRARFIFRVIRQRIA